MTTFEELCRRLEREARRKRPSGSSWAYRARDLRPGDRLRIDGKRTVLAIVVDPTPAEPHRYPGSTTIHFRDGSTHRMPSNSHPYFEEEARQ
jgi:hypothetical protein